MTAQTLAAAVAAEVSARGALEQHRKDAKARDEQLVRELHAASQLVREFSAGLDVEKVAEARRVLYLYGSYAAGGEGRDSVVRDMVDWLATGEKRTYQTPAEGYFGTKNYSGWRGQREDHQYGYGPRHGSTCFAVGIADHVRGAAKANGFEGNRLHEFLTPEEREAALYYLLNIERIEAAQKAAAA